MARRSIRRQRPRQMRSRRRQGRTLPRIDVPLRSCIGSIPFRGNIRLDVKATTPDLQISVSLKEIMTALGEELIGATITSAELQRLLGFVKTLRVTLVSTNKPLNVRYNVPSTETIATAFLSKGYLEPPLADIEAYPSPIKYPSVCFTWPRMYSVFRGGAGSQWFKVGSPDYILAMITVPGVGGSSTRPADVSLIITYDARYRWAESPFDNTSLTPTNLHTIASIKGWTTKLKDQIIKEAEKTSNSPLSPDERDKLTRHIRSADRSETSPSEDFRGSLQRLNLG